MKTLLALALLVFVPLAKADMAVDGNMNVIIDGSNYGRAEDYIAKRPDEAGTVFLAIRAYHTAVAEKAASDIAAVKSDADAAVKAAQAERDAALAAKSAADKTCAAECARTAAVVAALKSTATKFNAALPPEVAAAMLTEDEKAKAALTAQKAELEAKLAALK